MNVLCDIATTRYTFDHIWTKLLTQCTPVPVPVFCYFSISGSPLIKSTRKIPGKYRKNQRTGSFEKSPRGARGEPGGPRRPQGAAPPLAAPGGAWSPWPTSGCPFLLFIPRDEKPSGTEPFFAISPLFHRRHRTSKIGSTRRPLPGTLPEGGITYGSFSTTMDASQMNVSIPPWTMGP